MAQPKGVLGSSTRKAVDMSSGIGSRKIQVGVVGCGAIAAPHVTILNASRGRGADGRTRERVGDVALHLFDLQRPTAEGLDKQFQLGATIHTSLQSLLDARVDAVFILTPPDSHFRLCDTFLRAGVSVFVEKPFTCRLEEAVQLYQLANSSGLKLCVGHSTLFMPNVRECLERISQGEFGRPVAFHCFYGHAEPGGKIPYKDPSHWAYRMPGGLLINHVSHPASLLVELMGAPKSIVAQSGCQMILPQELKDSLSISVLGQKGMGSITVAMAQGNHHRHATIWCERGTIMLDLTRQTIVATKHNGPIGLVPKMLGGVQSGFQQVSGILGIAAKVALKRVRREPGVRGLAEAFIVCLRSGAETPVSQLNALGVQEIIERALFADAHRPRAEGTQG
jgi:predicted dehydrogenase